MRFTLSGTYVFALLQNCNAQIRAGRASFARPRRLFRLFATSASYRVHAAGATLFLFGFSVSTSAQPAPEGNRRQAPTTEGKREARAYLVVPIEFRDTQGVVFKTPHDLYDLFYDPQFGADVFLRTSSRGKLSLQGSKVAETLTLPRPQRYYQRDTGPWPEDKWYSQKRLLDDAAPLLEKHYDLHQFAGLVLFPNVVVSKGFGSTDRPAYRLQGDSAEKPYSVLYIKAAYSLAGIIHEIGHDLDIGHVRTQNPAVRHSASGMSFASDWVGVTHPRLLGLTCDHIMWHKELLGWTTPEEVRVINAPLDEIIRLYPRSGEGKGLRMVKLPLERYGEYLTLEAVLPAGIDKVAGLPKFGVLAHRVNQARVRRSNMGLYAESYLPEAQLSSAKYLCFLEGDAWSSKDAAQASFHVLRTTKEWCDVRVSLKKAFEHISNKQMSQPIELETCRLTPQGGKAMHQTMKPFGNDWGGDMQVFGMGRIGEGVDIEFASDEEGVREVLLGHTIAPDYGIVDIQVNNDPAIRIDAWAPGIETSGQRSLGRHQIMRGVNLLRVRLAGRNPKLQGERLCYGLDCLSLRP